MTEKRQHIRAKRTKPSATHSGGYTHTEEGVFPHYRHYIAETKTVLWIPVAVTVKHSPKRTCMEVRPRRDEHGRLLYALPGGVLVPASQ